MTRCMGGHSFGSAKGGELVEGLGDGFAAADFVVRVGVEAIDFGVVDERTASLRASTSGRFEGRAWQCSTRAFRISMAAMIRSMSHHLFR